MAYKKTSPTLQDSIEVFVEQVSTIEKTSKYLNEKKNELLQAAQKIEEINLKPNLTEFNSKINDLNSFSNQFNSVLNTKITEITEATKKSNSMSFYNFISIVLCLVIALISSYFAIRNTINKNELSKKIDIEKDLNYKLGSFIKSKNMEKEYFKYIENSKLNQTK